MLKNGLCARAKARLLWYTDRALRTRRRNWLFATETNGITPICLVAASKLGTFNLSGYEIYTSCEPCPMCLGAIYWARLDKMYYGNNKTDAKNIGFDDSFIYDELELKPENRKLPSEVLLHDEAIKAFEEWMEKEDKIEY